MLESDSMGIDRQGGEELQSIRVDSRGGISCCPVGRLKSISEDCSGMHNCTTVLEDRIIELQLKRPGDNSASFVLVNLIVTKTLDALRGWRHIEPDDRGPFLVA